MSNLKDLFYKPVKVKADPKEVLFWGCLHANHDPKWKVPLWKMRGFDSVLDHRETLIQRWNEVANENTVGFLLGDTMFGAGGKEAFEELLNRLSFKTLYLPAGNHYAGWHQSFSGVDENVLDLGGKQVVFTPNYFEAFVNGQAVCLSHYPVLSWNGQGGGSYMLYSHVHGTLVKSELGRLYKNSKMKCYEVSVEENDYPINFADLRKFMDKQNGSAPDHHGKDTQNPL
jgi:calcineurin-like phosphoesterase family protein